MVLIQPDFERFSCLQRLTDLNPLRKLSTVQITP
jgi:hypothetical protein